jgi:hypothetical protein
VSFVPSFLEIVMAVEPDPRSDSLPDKDRVPVTIEVTGYIGGNSQKPYGWATLPVDVKAQAVVARFYNKTDLFPISPPTDNWVKSASRIDLLTSKINFYFDDAISNPNNGPILVIWVTYKFGTPPNLTSKTWASMNDQS